MLHRRIFNPITHVLQVQSNFHPLALCECDFKDLKVARSLPGKSFELKSSQLKLLTSFPSSMNTLNWFKKFFARWCGRSAFMEAQSTGNLCGAFATFVVGARWQMAPGVCEKFREKTFCLVWRIKLIVAITRDIIFGYATQLNQSISLFAPTHRCHCLALLSRSAWHTFEPFRSAVTKKASPAVLGGDLQLSDD